MRKIIFSLMFLLCCWMLPAQSVDIENALVDAVAAYEAGNLDAAERALLKLHAADSTNDAVLYYLAMCEWEKDYQESAVAHLKKAAELDSTNTWYRSALANIYLGRGDYAAAAPLMEKLIVEEPATFSNPYMLTVLGDHSLQQYKDSLAMTYFERALMLDPLYAPAELGRAQVFDIRHNYIGYFSSLTNVVVNADVKPDIKVQYIKHMYENVTPQFYWVWGDQMNKLVDILTVIHPDDIPSQELKLQTCFIKRDMRAAIERCGIIARLAAEQGDASKLAEAYGNTGDIYHEIGDEKNSFRFYEAALKADPGYVPTLNNYAYYLSLKGKSLRKALKMSKVTIEKEPDNATYLDTYAWILHLLGRDAEAKPYFKHAMIYGGRESATVLEHYSEVLRALGENDLADYYKRLSEQKEK